MKATNHTLKFTEKPICVGTGLVALDVVISSVSGVSTQFLAGGSCGNVLTILSYLGWSSYPIARLFNNAAADLLLEDLQTWNVNKNLLSITTTGSTPIIIHRILKDSKGIPKHKFEFKNPEDGTYLPSYKPCLAKSVPELIEVQPCANVFYFDRINRGAIDLAKAYKKNGAIIFFEPSSVKDEKGFKECLEIADVIKFSEDRIQNYDHLYSLGRVPLEIQTLGSQGLKFRRKGQKTWINLAGYIIDDVVDAAGAGDWCTAGIIMNLFKKSEIEINQFSEDDLIFALQFGQALSALNCTFEGARGLMYNIPRNDLMLSIDHIVKSASKKIPKRNKSNTTYRKSDPTLKIASLF